MTYSKIEALLKNQLVVVIVVEVVAAVIAEELVVAVVKFGNWKYCWWFSWW